MTGNENWAKFPPPNSSEKNNDGDWADFGGFETALPVTDPQASNATGLISWAALSTAPQVPTDTGSLLQPIASHMDPNAAIPTSPDNSAGLQHYVQPSTVASLEYSPWAASFQSESSETSTPVAKKEVEHSIQIALPEEETYSLTMDTDRSKANSEQVSELTNELKEQREKTEKAVKLSDELGIKLTQADQEKIKFKKDLEDLMRKNELLKEESKETKEMLGKQKQKYSELQDEHEKQIKEIRQAGHDALAIIIEEYKELCKQAVLEQQQKSQSELHLFLENERQKFKETILQQQEVFEKTLSEERASSEERIKDALQAEQEKHKVLLESSVSKAQEEIKAGIQLIVEKTIEEGKEALKEAVANEKESHSKAMDDMEKLLQEEREKFKKTLDEALTEERKQSKLAIEEALAEQRNKTKDVVSKAAEETKAAMTEYTQQKLEVASKVQQKQFLAMDLFLESARTQLKSLMEADHSS